jgi:hypothetical protein
MDGQKGGAIDPERLKEMLAETADDVGRRGVYNLFSHGRVNAAAAVNGKFEMWKEIHQ